MYLSFSGKKQTVKKCYFTCDTCDKLFYLFSFSTDGTNSIVLWANTVKETAASLAGFSFKERDLVLQPRMDFTKL